MYLYDIKDNKLVIYHLAPNVELLKTYRRKLITNEERANRFNWLETNNPKTIEQFTTSMEMAKDEIHYENELDSYSFSCIHDYKSHRRSIIVSKLNQEELLQKYICGDYSKLIPIRIFEPNIADNEFSYIHNFIKLDECVALPSPNGEVVHFENMLNLPTELYILQLLEANQFNQLITSRLNFNEQIKLFEKPMICQLLTMQQFENLYACGLITQDMKEIEHQVANSQKILSKLI